MDKWAFGPVCLWQIWRLVLYPDECCGGSSGSLRKLLFDKFVPIFFRRYTDILPSPERSKCSGLLADNYHMTRFMSRAEVEGIVCSGECHGRQHTYALLDERVPPTPELTKEEALARLATAYFRSHAPATLQDFSWWSGLPLTEARQAISLIEPELMSEQWNSQTWYIHDSCRTSGKATGTLHLLPSYDEYLIGYKDRTDVLPKEDYSKAFTNNGLFFPVLLYKGHVVGNWNKASKKKEIFPEHSLFRKDICLKEELLNQAKEKYVRFLTH